MNAPLSPERLAEIAALIGDAKPATDDLLAEIAQQVKDRREHDHDSAADWDWYCLNASGWLGDRMPVVLRRLLDAQARVAELEKAARETDRAFDQTIGERDRLHDVADQLAYAVAPIEVIGEHSSDNDPWDNALDLIVPFAQVEQFRARITELEAERDGVAEYGIRVSEATYPADGVLLSGDTYSRTEQEHRVERYRDCWPHAELVARTVTRGAWTEAGDRS